MPDFPTNSEYEISVDQLSALLSDDEKQFLLIDVREEEEFAYCHLESAVLIPLSTFGETNLSSIVDDRERPMVVYCHHGMRSLQATSYLKQKGFPNVWSLAGGIDLWSQVIDSSVPRY